MQIKAFKKVYFSNIEIITNYILTQDNKRIIFNRRPPDRATHGHIDTIRFFEDNDLIFELISSSLTAIPEVVIDIISTFFEIGSDIDMYHLRWEIYNKTDAWMSVSYTAYRRNLIYNSERKRLSIAYASIPDYFCNVHADLNTLCTFRQFRQVTSLSYLSDCFTSFNFRLRVFHPSCPVGDNALSKLIFTPTPISVTAPTLLSRAEEEYRCCQAKCSLFGTLTPWVVDVRDDGSLVFGAGSFQGHW